jgi:hypothetical protein
MAGESRQVFISYARVDRQGVDALVEGLRQLHYDAWLDQELIGGQAWWDAVLSQIRASSAVLVAVSPAALESVAVRREYEYGQAVGRPLLPVIVDGVRHETLPSLLASLQVVDYCQPDTRTAFALAAALTHLPAPQPLPRPLPDPPPIPISYLSGLMERAQAATLDQDQQLVLIGHLKDALGRVSDREAAKEVLRRLQNRTDLYEASAREIESLLSPPNRKEPAPRPHEAQPASAPGTAEKRRWKLEPVASSRLRFGSRVETVRLSSGTEAHDIVYKDTVFWDTILVDGKVAVSTGTMEKDKAYPLSVLSSIVGTEVTIRIEIPWSAPPRLVLKIGDQVLVHEMQRSTGDEEIGSNVETEATISRTQALNGTTVEIRLAGESPCTGCKGTGKEDNGGRFFTRSSANPCPSCSGSGRMTDSRTFNVSIPAGIKDGQRVRLKGKVPTGGDIYITVHVTKH